MKLTLTPRQTQIVELLASDLENNQVAEELGLRVVSVKNQIQLAKKANDIRTRHGLVAQYIREQKEEESNGRPRN